MCYEEWKSSKGELIYMTDNVLLNHAGYYDYKKNYVVGIKGELFYDWKTRKITLYPKGIEKLEKALLELNQLEVKDKRIEKSIKHSLTIQEAKKQDRKNKNIWYKE